MWLLPIAAGTGGLHCKGTWQAGVWGLCRALVGSPAWAGSCHCYPLPVGFTNCISNFCRYFKAIFSKGSLHYGYAEPWEMCGMAGALLERGDCQEDFWREKANPQQVVLFGTVQMCLVMNL